MDKNGNSFAKTATKLKSVFRIARTEHGLRPNQWSLINQNDMRFPNEILSAFCWTETTIFAKTSAQCSTVIRHNFAPEPLAMVKKRYCFRQNGRCIGARTGHDLRLK